MPVLEDLVAIAVAVPVPVAVELVISQSKLSWSFEPHFAEPRYAWIELINCVHSFF